MKLRKAGLVHSASLLVLHVTTCTVHESKLVRGQKTTNYPLNANDVDNNECIFCGPLSHYRELPDWIFWSFRNILKTLLWSSSRARRQVTFFQCCFIQLDLTVVSLRDCNLLQYYPRLGPRGLLFQRRSRDPCEAEYHALAGSTFVTRKKKTLW